MLVWLMAGSLGAGVLGTTLASAQPVDETKAIKEDKVPEPVRANAQRHFLNATDVSYRKQEEGKNLYQVNYTIPGNVRVQLILNETGAVTAGPRLAPNQPNNAPGKKAQEQALAEWQARAQQIAEAQQRESIPRPGQQPMPPAQPGNQPLNTPGAQTAEVPASALPAAVAERFQRVSPDAREVRYFRLNTGNQTTYQMLFTTAGGERREFTLDERGQELAGGDRPAQPQAGQPGQPGQQQIQSQEVKWADVPPAVQKTLLPITGRDRDAKYYRQDRPEGVSYGALYQSNDREMWVRVGQNGDPIVNPVAAATGLPVGENKNEPQQAGGKLTPEQLRDRVNYVDLPKPVQDRVLRETEGAKEVINMTHRENNRTVHHTSWTDAQGRQRELWLNPNGEPVAPLR